MMKRSSLKVLVVAVCVQPRDFGFALPPKLQIVRPSRFPSVSYYSSCARQSFPHSSATSFRKIRLSAGKKDENEISEVELRDFEASMESDDKVSWKYDESSLPSFKHLLVFTATTIVIWVSESLLSLVDTSVVSLTSSARSAVVQIAALGPATTLWDSQIYATYFLAIATTNKLAPLLAKKKWKELRQQTSHLMGLSLVLGGLVSLITFGLGKQLITKMVGQALTEPGNIIQYATKYIWIRALVAPCVVVECVAQCFCLTILDTKTPAMAVLAASLINIFGDLALSPKWGIQGVAVATALASISSCLILLSKVRSTTRYWKQLQDENHNGNSDFSTLVKNGAIEMTQTTRSNHQGEIPFWSLPDKKSLLDLFRLSTPIFFSMMSKVACYSIMTIVATNFGIETLATHNIMMRVFFFFACFGDALGQAAQSFVPQVRRQEQGKLIRRLLGLSALVGLCNFQISNFILRRLGGLLTKDTSILKMMAEYSPYVALSVLIHPFIMFLEGMVLARRDLVFLVGQYVATLVIHFGFVFSPMCANFRGLWRALFFFQAIRLVQFATRTWSQSFKESQSI